MAQKKCDGTVKPSVSGPSLSSNVLAILHNPTCSTKHIRCFWRSRMSDDFGFSNLLWHKPKGVVPKPSSGIEEGEGLVFPQIKVLLYFGTVPSRRAWFLLGESMEKEPQNMCKNGKPCVELIHSA